MELFKYPIPYRRGESVLTASLHANTFIRSLHHALVQRLDEPVHRDAREASFVKELLLQPAEESLRLRVIRTASFPRPPNASGRCPRRCRSTQATLLRVATVGMDDRILSILERGTYVQQHALDNLAFGLVSIVPAVGTLSQQSTTSDRCLWSNKRHRLDFS